LAAAILITARSGASEQVAPVGRAHQAELAAVLTRANPLKTNLVLLTPVGERLTTLTTGEPRPIEYPPAWSPDGRKIAFTGLTEEKRADDADIYVVSVATKRVRRLTTNGRSTSPVWSPDGKTIAFARFTGNTSAGHGRSSIWTIRPDGSDPQRITNPGDGGTDQPSAFSSTGTLAFTRYTLAPHEFFDLLQSVFVVAPGQPETKWIDSGSALVFSADQTRIAYASVKDENGLVVSGKIPTKANELYVAGTDGSSATRLTATHDVDETYPSWSADGQQIVFQRTIQLPNQVENETRDAVYSINSDGTCLMRLAPGGKKVRRQYSSPSWRPGSAPGPIACDQA
jgi:Tol biopolymer transport system component